MIRQDENQVANEEYKRRNTKPCPRCQSPIEKNDGCDHMTCRRGAGGCGHEFCWLCLADYATILREGNHYHERTCTYYAPYREPRGIFGAALAAREEDDEDDEEDDEEEDGEEDG